MDICNRRSRSAPASIAIAIALTAAASAQTAMPTATNPPGPTVRTAADVIAGMQSFSKNLKSYEVPLRLRGGVKVTFITIAFEARGMEYYEAPNKQAVHLSGAPALAQRFQNTVATMGSPQTAFGLFDVSGRYATEQGPSRVPFGGTAEEDGQHD
jgi:hypothetical protein